MSNQEPGLAALTGAARVFVDEVSPAEARALVAQGACWVDVRDARELHDLAPLPGAVHLPRAAWATGNTAALPDRHRAWVLYCSRGERGPLAALALDQQGYRRVVCVRGGLQALLQPGLAQVVAGP
jgi:rhodanese-related sulfurtransferase